MRNTKYDWTRRVAQLRRAAASRDIAAITDLGLTLRDGIQDRQGRSLVRRNPAYAVRQFRLAAQSGDGQAAVALGHAYDIGQGCDAILHWPSSGIAELSSTMRRSRQPTWRLYFGIGVI